MHIKKLSHDLKLKFYDLKLKNKIDWIAKKLTGSPLDQISK